jgi:hypothetical protein
MKYYTYAHYTADTKDLFYIGKGTRSKDGSFKRSLCDIGRNYLWKNKVKKHSGFTCEILSTWETEKEAFDHEIFLIYLFQEKIVNLTAGGEGCSGRKHTEKEKVKRANSLRGLKRTPESLLRMSQAQKNNKVAQASLIASRELKKKQILCVDTGVIFNSLSEASEKTEISFQNISKVCKKQRQKAGGYRWEFVNGT